MTTSESRRQTEQCIREVLAAETHPAKLSNRLFAPDGLFNCLAETEEERRALADSPLFRQAQSRLAELRRAAAEMFRRAPSTSESVS